MSDKHPGGRPAGTKTGQARGRGASQLPPPPPPPAEGQEIDLEKLRKIAPEQAQTVLGEPGKEGEAKKPPVVVFSDEQVRMMCELVFYKLSNIVLDYLKRKKVTPDEAAKWAEMTQIVYGQYLKSLQAGAAIHGLFTLSLFFNKPKLEGTENGEAQA